LTLLAPTGERMGFYEAARQYDQKALQVIASIMMDEKQQASLRVCPETSGWIAKFSKHEAD
jgi:uncharacterized protein with PIN domain